MINLAQLCSSGANNGDGFEDLIVSAHGESTFRNKERHAIFTRPRQTPNSQLQLAMG